MDGHGRWAEREGVSVAEGHRAGTRALRRTVEAAIDNAVPLNVITASLFARFASRQDESPAMKAIAAMRNQFGGHATRTEAPPGGDANPDEGPGPGSAPGAGAGSGKG